MMKRTNDWKTAREKSSLLGTPSRFQHNFSGSKPNQTALPFAFPHMVTLRNPAQLTITATMLPTCGTQPQPLAGVANISRPNPLKTNSPRPTAIPRAVRIVSPKPSSPQVPEKPPPLLPPLPGRSYVDIIDDDDDDDDDDDTSSSGSSSIDFTEEEIYEESKADMETPAAEVTSLINCRFPQYHNPTKLFPTTLMQAHHLIDMEHFISTAQDNMSLYSSKVDNIVRGMKIHGPLNVNLLIKALEQVIKLHHILTLRVLHAEDYMLQASADKCQLNLAVTSDLRNELPGNIITQERRKPFSVHIKNDTVKPATETVPAVDDMHITSVVDYDHGDNTSDKMWPYQTLVRAKLIGHSPQDHLLVLTFSRLVCDYWSSCLFLQQLSQSYTQLEQGPSVNRLLTKTLRDDSRARFASLRQDSQHKLNRSFPGARTAFVHTARSKLQPIRQSSLPLSKKLMQHTYGSTNKPSILQSPQLQFQQVAIREKELLTMISKEKLWSFWQSMVTAIIKRALGPSRMKVVPPVRLPSQLGEGKTRPKTSRMRPLTARRNKVLTSDKNNPQLGPISSFHFIKVEEAVCTNFKQLFTEQGIKGIQEDEILHYMCLAGFVLLLGRCCRGWGPKKGLRKARPQTANLFDVGSFLIGIEVSLRQLIPEQTKGLIGPLTNNVPIRVNLSVCETFSDLVINLAKSVNSSRNHSHFPFSTVSHDHGMPAILPIKFSYLAQCDVKQLTNPQNFYFVETAVGVEGHGLARLGSNCYVTPINSKLDDSCYLELMMWESVDSNVVGGGFRYHNHVIAPDIVGKLGRELCRLLAHAAEDPGQTLANLVQQINPPFSHHRAAYQMK